MSPIEQEPLNRASIESLHAGMVSVPGGSIVLRDDRIQQKWKVDLQPFLCAKFPMTQALYFAVTGKAPSSFKGDGYPVENVSWNDAIDFCNLLSQQAGLKRCYSASGSGEEVLCDLTSDGFRLPSEAEWEYACRAGTIKGRYGAIDAIAWYKENSGGTTHEVGTKEPNGWGLYDMLGNVWEWCWDVYDADVYGSYRVFRGGGWNDPQRGCLASNRRRSHPAFRIDDLGFRVVRSR